MARSYSKLSITILNTIAHADSVVLNDLYRKLEIEHDRKTIYDCVFRLARQGLIAYEKGKTTSPVRLTPDGLKVLTRLRPKRDGIWRLVIFDIPERQRAVRNHLRSRLKALGFKKWQGSIWISPYVLDPDIEAELKALASKFFIRLVKTSDINFTADLELLFSEDN